MYHVNKSLKIENEPKKILFYLAPPERPQNFHSRKELKEYLQKV